MGHLTRRRLLATFAAVSPVGFAQNGMSRAKVVVSGGHPGDPEYGCGGTIARLADRGDEVVLLYMNRGEKHCPFTEDDPGSRVRVAEAQRACEILKARAMFVPQCDGHAVVDNEHYDEFRAILERVQPNAVFTHWPIDKHRDHAALAQLVHDAWLKMNRSFTLYYYEVAEDTMMFGQPTGYVNIANVEARRRAACYAHASQTPDHFYPAQVEISKFRGAESGFPQAEAFIRHVQSPPFKLPD